MTSDTSFLAFKKADRRRYMLPSLRPRGEWRESDYLDFQTVTKPPPPINDLDLSLHWIRPSWSKMLQDAAIVVINLSKSHDPWETQPYQADKQEVPWGSVAEYQEVHLAKLPTDEEVEGIAKNLRVEYLRELATEVVKGSVAFLRNPTAREEFLTLLSSCIAKAGEAMVADRGTPEIGEAVGDFAKGLLQGEVRPSPEVVALAYRIAEAAITTESPEVTLDVDGALAFDLRLRDGNRLLAELTPEGVLDGGVYGHDGERVKRVASLQTEEQIASAISGDSDARP